ARDVPRRADDMDRPSHRHAGLSLGQTRRRLHNRERGPGSGRRFPNGFQHRRGVRRAVARPAGTFAVRRDVGGVAGRTGAPNRLYVAAMISVLLTSYNRERYIAEAIESVLAQTFADFELIVSDDASSDGTVAIASA